MNGLTLVTAERERQVSEEGYTAEHDDAHGWRVLWEAGLCYVEGGDWPWEPEGYRPTTLARDLAKGGALAMAAVSVALRADLPKAEWLPAQGLLERCVRTLDRLVPDLEAAWEAGSEATAEWLAACGRPADAGPPDPPSNPYGVL